jgi:uncharacterized protein (TIGR04255 family)
MTTSLPSPLGGQAPAEIPLARSPLARVLAQVRFSSVLKIDSKEGVAPLQEELRANYPLLEQMVSQQLRIDMTPGGGGIQPVVNNVWRFSDAEHGLVLSLTSDALTLEARHYPGRATFLDRWADALSRVERVFAPGLALRTGTRYLNRLAGESLERLPDWVRPNLIGVAQPELREHVTQAISEANLKVEEGDLLLRWGVIPANATIDPGLLEPASTWSWILDIDVSSGQQKPFNAVELAAEYGRLMERAYSVFRWVVTEEGLQHFGAQG